MIDPDSGAPLTFWSFVDNARSIREAGGELFGSFSRAELVQYFLVYVQLRADLADVVLQSQHDCSEDAADDVADGIIAQGRDAYVAAMGGDIPERDAWRTLEKSMMLHEFDHEYMERYGAEIWDETDALEEDRLPWEAE